MASSCLGHSQAFWTSGVRSRPSLASFPGAITGFGALILFPRSPWKEQAPCSPLSRGFPETSSLGQVRFWPLASRSA